MPPRRGAVPNHWNKRRHGDVTGLVLGTAQIGQSYGVANTTGTPTESASINLIRAAIAAGVRCIDTARAYGQAERRIGLALAANTTDVHVVTKLDPLAHLPAIVPADIALAAAAASLAASREALVSTKIDTLLLHRADHLTMWGGGIWRMLIKERDDGRIGRLGISVQSPAEAFAALDNRNVEHLQMPFNLFDHRWEEVIAALRNRREVVVHVRSVLLQGLLAGTPEARWPAVPGVSSHDVLPRLTSLAEKLRRTSVVDLCIAFVRAQEWIDGIVIGMETIEQLTTNLNLFENPPLSADDAASVRASLPRLPDTLLDPAQWPTH